MKYVREKVHLFEWTIDIPPIHVLYLQNSLLASSLFHLVNAPPRNPPNIYHSLTTWSKGNPHLSRALKCIYISHATSWLPQPIKPHHFHVFRRAWRDVYKIWDTSLSCHCLSSFVLCSLLLATVTTCSRPLCLFCLSWIVQMLSSAGQTPDAIVHTHPGVLWPLVSWRLMILGPPSPKFIARK
jgi:hypothetical protein